RYLSQWGHQVAIIGPDEPPNHQTHDGVFGSHYDQGRLTRQLGRDPLYSLAAKQAIANYRMLEEQSGVPFYNPVGMILADRAGLNGRYTGNPAATAAELGVDYHFYEAGDSGWQAQFPYLAFPEDFAILFEPGPAGYINPRGILQAQLTIAKKQGAALIAETAVGVTADDDGVTVQTKEGQSYRAQKVLVAAGAFTNFCGLLPRPIPLRIKTETIILARVSDQTAAELKEMPTIIYEIDDPEIDDIYVAPPILYPDGRYYVKMGCNTAADQWPTTLEAVQAWFKTGDSDICKSAMIRALQSQLPAVVFEAIESKRCIVCYTPSGAPTIDLVHERIAVAAGGNGSGAKGSDTWGHLAAGLLVDGRWPDAFPREPFLAQAADQ
ncbi:MAG: FAD-dependent oxidoreductase, partial [Anaerolineales bacterium]|nr:FAD-dependent oxidoreductase [Anaerolineales bacterium]